MRRSSIRARRSSSGGPVPVKRRGPAPIIIILGVIVAGVFCWVMGRGCGGSQDAKQNDALRAYASSMNKYIERSNTIAEDFDTFRNSDVKDMSRDTAVKKMNQLLADATNIAQESSTVKPPDKATDLQPILQMVFEKRANGLQKYVAGMTDVLDRKNTSGAVTAMQQGLWDLVFSDESYQRYKGGLETKLKQAKSGDLGGVEVATIVPYVPKQDDALLASVNAYVQHFEGTDVGDELHGVSVAGVTTSPAHVDTTADGVFILPYNNTFNATVAVQNQGNQEEENIQVVASLTTSDGGNAQTQTKKITLLKPDETTTLVFDQLKPVTGTDKMNTLKVMAGPVPNEKRIDNNQSTFKFIMKPEGQ